MPGLGLRALERRTPGAQLGKPALGSREPGLQRVEIQESSLRPCGNAARSPRAGARPRSGGWQGRQRAPLRRRGGRRGRARPQPRTGSRVFGHPRPRTEQPTSDRELAGTTVRFATRPEALLPCPTCAGAGHRRSARFPWQGVSIRLTIRHALLFVLLALVVLPLAGPATPAPGDRVEGERSQAGSRPDPGARLEPRARGRGLQQRAGRARQDRRRAEAERDSG